MLFWRQTCMNFYAFSTSKFGQADFNIKQGGSQTSSVACFSGHYFGMQPVWNKFKFDPTLTNLILHPCFILLWHPGLFSPSLNPTSTSWNLTWLWMALTNLFLHVCFIFLWHPGLFSPSLNLIWASWNLTWPFIVVDLTLVASDPLTNIAGQHFLQAI